MVMAGDDPQERKSSISLKDFEEPVFALDKHVSPPLNGKDLSQEKLSPETLQQLIEELSKLQHRVTLLQQEASESCSKLRREVSDWNTTASGSIEKLVHGWDATRKLMADAEKKTATLAQVALLHGNRLKTARAEKDRAITAIRRLNHLQMFAHATSIDSLPALFHDETRAGEAGATARSLLTIVQEVVSAMQSTGGIRSEPPPLGSIEAALRRLEEYCGRLDARIVSRFDEALARSDYAAMAACSRALVEAKRAEDSAAAAERALTQRYVSTRPMFTDGIQDLPLAVDDEETRHNNFGGLSSSGHSTTIGTTINKLATTSTALRRIISSIRLLYKSLLQAVIKETVIAEQAFQDPQAAMAALLTRVFEQRVSGAVDAAFKSFDEVADALADIVSPSEILHDRMLLVAEITQRTWELAADTREVIMVGGRGEAGVVLPASDLAETSLASHINSYMEDELAWLAAAYEEDEIRANDDGITLPSFIRLLAAHREAVERASQAMHLGPALADTIVALHGDTLSHHDSLTTTTMLSARPSTLVGQASAMLEGGLHRAARHETLQQALNTLGTLSAAVELLWAHHSHVTSPLLSQHSSSLTACSATLRTLQARLDVAGGHLLESAMDRSIDFIARQLRARQDNAEFLVATPSSNDLEHPTQACREATISLAALLSSSRSQLHGPNSVALVSSLAARIVELLRQHMHLYRFSPLGALVWRRDLQAYETCLVEELGVEHVSTRHDDANSSGGVAAINITTAPELAQVREAVQGALQEMREQASLLFVVPEALPGVLSSLPDREAALKVIKLRLDYEAATVDGRPLEAAVLSS